MIGDFVASQWFLWDAVSSIKRPARGVAPGQTWESQLSVPLPMVFRVARDVTCRLGEVRRADGGRVAVIESTYTLAPKARVNWPVPYAGPRFQVSGTFGFLGGYQVSGLHGRGCERFDVDAGRVEDCEQRYTVEMDASLPPMGVHASPHIRIDQTLTMERVDAETPNSKSKTDRNDPYANRADRICISDFDIRISCFKDLEVAASWNETICGRRGGCLISGASRRHRAAFSVITGPIRSRMRRTSCCGGRTGVSWS